MIELELGHLKIFMFLYNDMARIEKNTTMYNSSK